VAGEVAVGGIGGVGVGVEMDDAEIPESVVFGDGGGAGPGDRVIAADDQGMIPRRATSATRSWMAA
jgi:hypothetical protein